MCFDFNFGEHDTHIFTHSALQTIVEMTEVAMKRKPDRWGDPGASG